MLHRIEFFVIILGTLLRISFAKSANVTSSVLKVAYLTSLGSAKDHSASPLGFQISGAMSLAISEVNEAYLIPGVQLELVWNFTGGDQLLSSKAVTEFICNDVVAFFGPEISCNVEATIASSFNLPMISYKCADYTVSNKRKFPTFARTFPPDNQVSKSVIALLKYHGWKKFSIIAQDSQQWRTISSSLSGLAIKNNMTINTVKTYKDIDTCCRESWHEDGDGEMSACCKVTHSYLFTKLVDETYSLTRSKGGFIFDSWADVGFSVYVFLGSAKNLRELMTVMQIKNLLDNGQYVIVLVEPDFDNFGDAWRYLWSQDAFQSNESTCHIVKNDSNLAKARSLLVVAPSPPGQKYQNFIEKVRQYNSKPPFLFTDPFSLKKHIPVTAAYLYDSVYLYATAIVQLIDENPFVSSEEIIRNGSAIIQQIIAMQHYRSIIGTTVSIDHNGDSEGNFTVLALKKFNYVGPRKRIRCPYYMIPVGQFHHHNRTNDSLPVYIASLHIDWPTGNVPKDEPLCGFENEKCPKSTDGVRQFALYFSLLLFVSVLIVGLIMYKNWKYEKEIEGLQWKIDPNDIIGFPSNTSKYGGSKVSLSSSVSSESHAFRQNVATTAIYKGVVIRIKEIKLIKGKDLSRSTKKEMRYLREMRHININSFIGAILEATRIFILTEYCAKGSLMDVLENVNIKLDNIFMSSLVQDLLKGMIFLHSSDLKMHGNLKSTNCVITSRWVLQLSDFGLHELRQITDNTNEFKYYSKLLWKSPELLRDPYAHPTPKSDVYAFGIILYEIYGRQAIVERVRRAPHPNEKPFRPDLNIFSKEYITWSVPDDIIACMKESWAEQAEMRPNFDHIKDKLKNTNQNMKSNLVDHMMMMMERYANHLEELVTERTHLLIEEKRKTEDLLHRMLPESVAKRLIRGLTVKPESFESVTIYFSDIVGFTAMSAESTPMQVVSFLNELYTLFDDTIRGFDVYKVETIGDAYMVVSGLPIRNENLHAGYIASMALELLDKVRKFKIPHRQDKQLQLRIGIHTGPVVAGVVGLTMPRYCLFGDTVNTASRMESTGEPLRIHISQECKDVLDVLKGYKIEKRGLVRLKGKGEKITYWLTGAERGALRRSEESEQHFKVPFFPHYFGEFWKNGYKNAEQKKLIADQLGKTKSFLQNTNNLNMYNLSKETINRKKNGEFIDNDNDFVTSRVSKSMESVPPDYHLIVKRKISNSLQDLNNFPRDEFDYPLTDIGIENVSNLLRRNSENHDGEGIIFHVDINRIPHEDDKLMGENINAKAKKWTSCQEIQSEKTFKNWFADILADSLFKPRELHRDFTIPKNCVRKVYS